MGPTALLPFRRAEDFSAPKNPTASAGFEPANSGTKGFLTFTLFKVIDMVLLLIFSHEKQVECTLSVPHVTLPFGKYGL